MAGSRGYAPAIYTLLCYFKAQHPRSLRRLSFSSFSSSFLFFFRYKGGGGNGGGAILRCIDFFFFFFCFLGILIYRDDFLNYFLGSSLSISNLRDSCVYFYMETIIYYICIYTEGMCISIELLNRRLCALSPTDSRIELSSGHRYIALGRKRKRVYVYANASLSLF